MMDGLSETSLRVLQTIDRYIQAHAYAPTHRDLALETHVKSTSTVAYHLALLRGAGLIQRQPQLSRALIITPKGKSALRDLEQEG